MSSLYVSTQRECDAVKAMAFKLLMSNEIKDITGPLASQLFDLVSDRSEEQADEEIKHFLEFCND